MAATTMPTAGLVEDLEREVLAAIGAITAGVLPVCQQCWCGHQMTPTGGGHWHCGYCGGTYQGSGGAVEVLPAEAADIGGGNCENCGQPVSTLGGKYACNSCGHCN